MKKLLAPALLMTLLSACPIAFAQNKASSPPSPPEIVAGFLSFSQEQLAQFGQLLENFGNTMQDIQQKAAAKSQQIEKLAAADPPDPAAIGKAFLELKAIQKLAGQAIDGYHEQFVSLLTTEQKEKVQAVAQAAQLLPAVQAFAALSLVGPPAAK
jgi:flagellar hook-basal body complex protein FliE